MGIFMKKEKKYAAADALADQLVSAEYEYKHRPKGRERNITGEGKGVSRRGDGLGTGPVGPGRSAKKRPERT